MTSETIYNYANELALSDFGKEFKDLGKEDKVKILNQIKEILV